MHRSLLIVLVLGLSSSIYALDLSHAAQPETPEVDPRIFNFINDFYAQVVYPPLNHIVTNVALLGAQVLAGISVNGLPTPGGRTVQLTEAELRGFWSGLWNDAIRPPIENAISGISLMAAQVLAGIGINGVDLSIGKRDLTVEDARILDALSQAFNNVFANVIQKPLEDALSSGALMLAQVLAGVGVNGVNLSNLGSLLGKREITAEDARIIDALTQALNNVFANVIQKPLEDALSSGALMLAQVLAGVGVNGVNLSNLGSVLGKREITAEDARIIDALTQALNNVFTNVIQKPLEDALSSGALMLAQVLAGVGVNGVNLSNLGGLLGKRDLTAEDARIIDALTQALNNVFANVIQKPLEDALSSGALMLAQVLAGVGVNGVNLSNLGGLLGKRDLTAEDARIIDALTQALNNVFANVIQKPLEDALSSGALMLAQVLAGVGVNGVNLSNLGGLLGKREITAEDARIIDALTQALNNVFANVIQKPLEDALSSGALMLAQVLAGVGVNGVNLSNLGGLLGKRDLTAEDARIIDALTQALNNVFANVIQKPLEDALSSGALMLAQVLAGVGVNGVNLSNLGGLLGKREITAEDARIIDALTQALNNVFANVIQKPLEDALSSGALMLAQVLAGVGVNGVNLSNLGSLLGKRDLTANEAAIRGVLDTVGGAVVNGLQSVWNSIFAVPLGNFIQNGALAGAQILAGLGTNGVNLGKRSVDVRGAIIDNLLDHATGLYTNQVKPIVENALNNAALQLAALLANFSQTGFGRR